MARPGLQDLSLNPSLLFFQLNWLVSKSQQSFFPPLPTQCMGYTLGHTWMLMWVLEADSHFHGKHYCSRHHLPTLAVFTPSPHLHYSH